jgi:hypothetical protein
MRTGSDIAKFCFQQIGRDPRLLVFPVIAGVMIVLIFFIYFGGLFLLPDPDELPAIVPILLLLLLAALYIVTYFIRVFSEAAMVAYVHARLEGGNPSVGLGYSRARDRAGMLFKWALIAAIVGVISEVLSNWGAKSGQDSRITRTDGSETEFTSFGEAVGAATYFGLPMILFEDQKFWKTPGRSERLVTEFWGEVMVGRLAVGIIFVLLVLPAIIIFLVGLILESNTGFIIAVIAAAYIITIASVRGVSGGVLSAAMYRYTQTGGIDLDLPKWLHPTEAPIARGKVEVDIDIESKEKKAEAEVKRKKKEKVEREISKEGKARYYLKNALGYTFAAMFLLGILNLWLVGTIITSLIFWGIAVAIVVVMYAAGMIEVVDASPAKPQGPITVSSKSGPSIGNRVLVSDGGTEFQGMVTGIDYRWVTVRLKDGSERHVEESCCTVLS